MKVVMEKTVNGPADRVFEVFSDIQHCGDRIKGITKVEVLSDVKQGTGLRWRETRVMLGKEATEEMEMTASEPPNSYTVEARSHGMHYISVFTFEPRGAATHVRRCTSSAIQPAPRRWGTPLAAGRR